MPYTLNLTGKPFSAIPILSSTTGFLTSSQTPYTRLPQPDRQEPETGQTSRSCYTGAAASDSAHSSAAALKLNESQSETDFSDDVMGKPLTSRYPSDAKFPGKHSLFFADCLSNKHKESHNQ